MKIFSYFDAYISVLDGDEIARTYSNQGSSFMPFFKKKVPLSPNFSNLPSVDDERMSPNDIDQKLYEAVVNDNDESLSQIALLYSYKPSHIKGCPILHLAVENNAIKCLKYFIIQEYTNVDMENENKQTSIHIATIHNQLECVEYLLNNGANSGPVDCKGITPLHYAVAMDRWDIAGVLLSNHAPVDAKCNGSNETPLHVAAKQAQGTFNDYVTLLIDHKADVNAQNKKGETPLHLAVNHKINCNVTNLIKAEAIVNSRNNYQQTPLHYAAFSNNPNAIQEIVSSLDNEIVNEKDHKGKTALHVAVKQNHIACVDILLRSGANVDALDDKRFSPLCYSVMGKPEIARLLLSFGANPNGISETTKNTFSSGYELCTIPIHIAIVMDELECLKTLLEGNACPETKNKKGDTALHAATKNNNYNCVRQLLIYRARISARDTREMTPMEIAVENGYTKVIKVILDYAVEPHQEDPRNYNIDFACLFPSKQWPEMDVLATMNNSFKQEELEDILKHPVVHVFTTLKLRKMRFVRVLSAIILFVFFWTAFVYLYQYNKCLFEGSFNRNITNPGSNFERNSDIPDSKCYGLYSFHFWVWIVWAFQVPFHLYNEFRQAKASRIRYFYDLERWPLK